MGICRLALEGPAGAAPGPQHGCAASSAAWSRVALGWACAAWRFVDLSAAAEVLQAVLLAGRGLAVHLKLGGMLVCSLPGAEVLEAAQLSGQGFTLRARCTSEGVPFATCFANHVQVGAHMLFIHMLLCAAGACKCQPCNPTAAACPASLSVAGSKSPRCSAVPCSPRAMRAVHSMPAPKPACCPPGPAVGGHAAWCALQSPGGDRWVLRRAGVFCFIVSWCQLSPTPMWRCTLPACLQGCICLQPGTLHAAGVHFAAASSGPELHQPGPTGPSPAGECRFHSPVWGPLKGQIERESIKVCF